MSCRPRLTKHQREQRIRDRRLHHTPACREHNPRGQRSHMHGCPTGLFPERLTMFGGYHCICDFEDRLHAPD